MDHPRLDCVAGVLQRRWRNAPADMASGCPERIDLAFLRRSGPTPARRSRELAQIRARGKGDALVRLWNRRQAQVWLEGVN